MRHGAVGLLLLLLLPKLLVLLSFILPTAQRTFRFPALKCGTLRGKKLF